MQEEMPSQEEQDIAEEYCCKRPLERPDTNIRKAIIYFFSFVLVNILFSVCVSILFDWIGTSFILPQGINYFIVKHPILEIVLIYLGCSFISFCILLKKVIIGVVRLYQHYAPEDVRRRCLFKPTCSEYMILAVNKYGAIRGVYKGMDRLLNKCRGNIYRIDYP